MGAITVTWAKSMARGLTEGLARAAGPGLVAVAMLALIAMPNLALPQLGLGHLGLAHHGLMGTAQAHETAPPADHPLADLSEAELLDRFGLSGDQLGYVVFDAQSGDVLAERNPDRGYIPASTVKLLTAVMALGTLGGEHRFSTGLYVDGTVGNGRIQGDLYLRGGGDPFLSADNLQVMADNLASRGITAIDGQFFYDGSALIESPQINERQPESVAYNTSVGGLSLNFNRIRVDWEGQGDSFQGSATAVTDTLAVPLANVEILAAPPGTPGYQPYQRLDGAGERWMISPELPSPGNDWLPVARPGLLAGVVFQALAQERGLALPDPTAGTVPAGAREVAIHESAPLATIMREILRWSNNMAAELVGMTAGGVNTGRPLGVAFSASAMENWLATTVPGFSSQGIYLDNHSGLSSDARLTPSQMAAVLSFAATRPIGGTDIWTILRPVRWLDEVAERASDDAATIDIRAKTGTMHYGRGLAGYIDSASGRRLGFAIFISDIEARRALDDAFDARNRYSSGDARRWLERARALERELVTRWALDN